MSVTINDLERLAIEFKSACEDGPEWLVRTGLEEEAMKDLMESACSAVMDSMCCHEHMHQMLYQVVGESFRLGWELRDQYGRPGDESEVRDEDN